MSYSFMFHFHKGKPLNNRIIQSIIQIFLNIEELVSICLDCSFMFFFSDHIQYVKNIKYMLTAKNFFFKKPISQIRQLCMFQIIF